LQLSIDLGKVDHGCTRRLLRHAGLSKRKDDRERHSPNTPLTQTGKIGLVDRATGRSATPMGGGSILTPKTYKLVRRGGGAGAAVLLAGLLWYVVAWRLRLHEVFPVAMGPAFVQLFEQQRGLLQPRTLHKKAEILGLYVGISNATWVAENAQCTRTCRLC